MTIIETTLAKLPAETRRYTDLDLAIAETVRRTGKPPERAYKWRHYYCVEVQSILTNRKENQL
jgi:hypothetical protein